MKLFYFLVGLFFVSDKALSQDKGYIALSAGIASPIDNFASKDPNNTQEAGYARVGGFFDISAGYKLGKNFGVSALLLGRINSVDVQVLANQYALESQGAVQHVTSTSWKIGGGLVGGYGSFPVAEKISIETKLMFGFLRAQSPKITVFVATTEGPGWAIQKSGSGSAFAFLFDTGFKYDLNNKVCLLLNFNYLHARPEFSNIEISTSDGYFDMTTFKQYLGTINYTFGIGYRLYK